MPSESMLNYVNKKVFTQLCLKIIFFPVVILAQEKTSDDALVKQLLTEDLRSRKFSFAQVIASASGHKVLAFNPKDKAHQIIVSAIEAATRETISTLNQQDSPVKKLRRINEASRFFEELILKKLAARKGFSCTIPKNTSGKAQRSGYPDMRIEHLSTKTVFYLDPKLFEKKSRASSFRTFYFEPKIRTMKIHDDAVHLLLGISHDGKDGDWTFLNYELVDLSSFQVRLKAEFQASNKDLYQQQNIIRQGSAEK